MQIPISEAQGLKLSTVTYNPINSADSPFELNSSRVDGKGDIEKWMRELKVKRIQQGEMHIVRVRERETEIMVESKYEDMWTENVGEFIPGEFTMDGHCHLEAICLMNRTQCV